MGYKTRGSYGTGWSECPKNCVCIFCKRKREEEKKERRDYITEYFNINGRKI